jgi:hypothetical protein
MSPMLTGPVRRESPSAPSSATAMPTPTIATDPAPYTSYIVETATRIVSGNTANLTSTTLTYQW